MCTRPSESRPRQDPRPISPRPRQDRDAQNFVRDEIETRPTGAAFKVVDLSIKNQQSSLTANLVDNTHHTYLKSKAKPR